ncbi:MAG: magnesium transporter [Gemmatimonadetes bacterium]|nr:magnesium transporter [Gemmatimonadota bacterium]
MAETGIELALGLLRTHPETAAAVLESLPAGSAAALLEEVEPRIAAPVIARMLPSPASRCLLRMNPEPAAAILHAMPPAGAAQLLRAWPAQRRDTMLTALPNRTSIVIRLLLGFPVTSVGAWMDPEPLLLPDDANAGAALNRLRAEARDLDRVVFVVDREQQLRGRVRTVGLLRADPAAPLHSLVETAAVTLQARGDLLGYRDDPGWTPGDPLPVIARDGRVIGVLSHSNLVRGLAAARPAGEGVLGDPALNLADGYWIGLASLVEGLIGILPAGSPAVGEPVQATETQS